MDEGSGEMVLRRSKTCFISLSKELMMVEKTTDRIGVVEVVGVQSASRWVGHW